MDACGRNSLLQLCLGDKKCDFVNKQLTGAWLDQPGKTQAAAMDLGSQICAKKAPRIVQKPERDFA